MTTSHEDMKIYYPGKELSSDGQAKTIYVADSGTLGTIVDAALTQAENYWLGAIVIFEGDTPTVALRGQTTHVIGFNATTDTLTLARNLAAVVATGEKYKIILGGNYRSSTEILGLLVSGQFPELEPLAATNVTGVTIKYVSPTFLADAGFSSKQITLDWVQGSNILRVIVNAVAGTPFVVAGDSSGTVLKWTNGGYIIIDVVQASLPGGNANDVLTTSERQQTFNPDIEGNESLNALKGKTRYRLQVVKNVHATDQMTDVRVFGVNANKDVEPVATTLINNSLAVTAGTTLIASTTNWPASGFWVLNTTKDDVRYVERLTGTVLVCKAANEWTKLTADANNTVEPLPGQTITSSAGGSAIIDQVILNSGTWGGGDANATFYLKNVSGAFNDTNQLQVAAVNICIQDGAEAKGLRDKTAVTWDIGDSVQVITAVDLAVQAPSADQFANPASETVHPGTGIDFAVAVDVPSGIVLGNLAADEIYGVWEREWIMDDMKANTNFVSSLGYSWA